MVIRIILILIFFTCKAYSKTECSNFAFNQFAGFEKKNKIEKINVQINKKETFFKRASRYYVAVNSKGTNRHKNAPKYLKQYKKKFKAKIILEASNGKNCSLPATIRGHGDRKDHFDLKNGVPISSYRIKLEEGNINHITRFILFLPKSRNFDNEIFISTFLKELGFLSPRTFKVKVKINNVESEYIFQENLKKEFLEDNSRVEGPILEANEDLSNFNKLSLARISNKEWIKGIDQNYNISIHSLRKFNFHRLNGFSFRIQSLDFKNSEGLAIDEVLRFDKKNLEYTEANTIGTFQAFMYALDASHALSYDDSRFYYDPIYSIIEPIYYDGDTRIMSILNYDPYKGKFVKNLENWKRVKDINLDFEGFEDKSFKYNLSNQVVSVLAKENAKKAIDMLSKLDKSKLLSKLQKNGLTYLNNKQLDELLNFVSLRLVEISNSKVAETLSFEGNTYKKYENKMNLKSNSKLVFLENLDLKKNVKNIKVTICDNKLINCNEQLIDENKFIDLLEQNNLGDGEHFFLAMKKKYYELYNNEKIYSILDNNFKIYQKDENINLLKNEGTEVNFDKDNKIININYKFKNSKVIFFDSFLDSWKINMVNNFSGEINDSFKNKRITGCLTIIDSKIKDLSIEAEDFFCEDTVNVIRSSGSLKLVKLKNSQSDGLDIDFSNISIENLDIYNARNDCADFSYGNYIIKNSKINKCNDKGISVGENSKIQIENLFVENTLIGLASKDSSKVIITDANLKNLETCLSAYNKKQEFLGGYIKVVNLVCNNFLNLTAKDQFSEILLNKTN